MTKNRIPHDSIFKTVFEDVNAVIEFIDKYLPPHVAALIDKEKLVRDNESYLTKAMRKLYADVVYRTTIKGEDTALILLFEHKKDKKGVLPFQLLQYMVAIWVLDIKNKRPFSNIIPIVIFHGDKVTVARPFSSYFNFQSDITNPFIPNFNYIFLNVKKEADESLFSLPTISGLRSLFLLFKHIKNHKFIIRNLLEILKIGEKNKNNDDILSQILLYLFSNSDISESMVSEILDSQPEAGLKKIGMTTAQQLIKKGKTEGRTEGRTEERIEIVRNAWEKGYTKYQIADFTKLSIIEIEKLIMQFDAEVKKKIG